MRHRYREPRGALPCDFLERVGQGDSALIDLPER